MTDEPTEEETKPSGPVNRGGVRHDFRIRWPKYPRALKEKIAGGSWPDIDELIGRDGIDQETIDADLAELDVVTAEQDEHRHAAAILETQKRYLYARLLAQDVEQSVVGEHAHRTAMTIKYATGTPKPVRPER